MFIGIYDGINKNKIEIIGKLLCFDMAYSFALLTASSDLGSQRILNSL